MTGKHDALTNGQGERTDTGVLVLGEVRAALGDLVSGPRTRRHKAPKQSRSDRQAALVDLARERQNRQGGGADAAPGDPDAVDWVVGRLVEDAPAPAPAVLPAAQAAEAVVHPMPLEQPRALRAWLDDVFVARVQSYQAFLAEQPPPPQTVWIAAAQIVVGRPAADPDPAVWIARAQIAVPQARAEVAVEPDPLDVAEDFSDAPALTRIP